MSVASVNSIMWTAYPWRWSLKALTPIALVNAQQDYTNAETDFMKLIRARVTRTDTTPDVYNDILILKWLPPELSLLLGLQDIESVCFEPTITKFRLNASVNLPTGVTGTLNGEYQKVPTKVTAATTAFLFPDEYFSVFVSGLTWQFYLFADDPRAGERRTDGHGNTTYTGQMGVFYDALMMMRESEDWGAGDTIFPQDPLGAYRTGNPGLFGL